MTVPNTLHGFTVAQLTTLDVYDTIDGVTEVPISTVAPGYRFQLVFSTGKRWAGTVVRHTSCSTSVILDGLETERSFTTAEGQVVSIRKQGGVQHWSPQTPVLRIDGSRNIDRWVNPQGEAPMEAATERTASLLGGGGAKRTPKSRKARKAAKAGKAKTAKAPREKKVKELHDCKCGCGDKVTGSFRQGHDARYYGFLKKVAAEVQPFNSLPRIIQNEAGDVAGVKAILRKSKH